MTCLIGFGRVVANGGKMKMEILSNGSAVNGFGIAHGGMVATSPDTAMGRRQS